MERLIKKLKSPTYTATMLTFFGGLLIHIFGLVNVLHNHDSIYRVPTGYGTGVRSGRWFLTVLGELAEKLLGGYNLAWINGVIFIFLVAITAGIIVRVFNIKTHGFSILIGLCMVAFPAVASTLFYRFTSVYYGVSILLAVIAVYTTQKCKYGFLISVLCIALSMGIYQAYVSFTISLFVILLIKLCLEYETTIKQLIKTGFNYVLILLTGFLLYFIAMKLSLIIYNTDLVDYKGINDMGVLAIGKIPTYIKDAFLSVVKLPIQDYEDIAQTTLVRVLYLAVGVISLIELIIIFIKQKIRVVNIIVCLVFCVLFPIAANFVVIMCGIEEVYTLMVYPLVTILFLPVVFQSGMVLTEGGFKKAVEYLKKSTVTILIIIIFYYSYQANVNYTIQYYNNQQVTNYYNRMISQVQMTKGYDTEKEWIILGKVKDPLLTKSWNKVNHYGGNLKLKTIINLRRTSWMEEYLGINIPLAKALDKEKIKETETVKNMPCWPNEGSIQIIDDFVVIKLS